MKLLVYLPEKYRLTTKCKIVSAKIALTKAILLLSFTFSVITY
jgi:hypothetical protein